MTAVKARQFILLAGDVATLYLSLAVMIVIRYTLPEFGVQYVLHILPFSIIFFVWILLAYINGLYDLYLSKPTIALYRRFTESVAMGLTIAVGLFYLIPIFGITPKTNLFILAGVYAIIFIGWRTLMHALPHTAIRVLAVNPHADTLELLSTLERNKQLGYEIAGVLVPEGTHVPKNLTVFHSHEQLRALVSEHHISLVLVTKNDAAQALMYRELYELLFWNVHVMPADSFFETMTGRVSLSVLSEAWFFENLKADRVVAYDVARRIAEYILCVFALLALLCVFPLIAIAIKATSRGPLFYKQERVGKNGKRFWLIKFRTMFALDKQGGAELRGAQFTTHNDPRITPVGKLMRTLRLDELPQIFNVLRGDMSLIGPRPERPKFVYEFERTMPYYTVRHLIKPGVTGWAQINYPYAATPEQQLTKFQYDLYYVKNRSFFLDLTILLKTFHVILYRKGQ